MQLILLRTNFQPLEETLPKLLSFAALQCCDSKDENKEPLVCTHSSSACVRAHAALFHNVILTHSHLQTGVTTGWG